ncbi:MAG: hypothetical protein AW07_01844 [Candidatus Accumulibacter sp. SK-11]|nr:MAG: hypothetical protein AW07_01844 [Candidatus Accumulibacter sp. SK-11]
MHDAEQLAGLRVADRRNQHLLRPVTGPLVDRLEETQTLAVFSQFFLVVDVTDVDGLARRGNVAGDTLLGNRQADVLVRVETGFHFRDDAVPVVAGDVDRQSVGVEQLADVFRHF